MPPCPRCGSTDPGDCGCKPYARPSSGQLDLFAPDGRELARELYGGPAPFQRHSDTSREAAERVEPVAETERGRVLALLRENAYQDGLTDEEMQSSLDMNPSTQRPRRIELVRSGHVVDSGERRKTEAGRRAVVWVAAENA